MDWQRERERRLQEGWRDYGKRYKKNREEVRTKGLEIQALWKSEVLLSSFKSHSTHIYFKSQINTCRIYNITTAFEEIKAQ